MKEKIAFALIMGGITTGIISFILIAVNVGVVPKFFSMWLRSWLLAYVIAIPAILVIAPRVEQLADYLFRDKRVSNNNKKS